jgi:DNA-binding NarL/FixJ family response regulator
MIRVLVTDDDSFVRKGIISLIELNSEIKVIAEAATGIEAIELVEKLKPDVILMDVRMPELDGITAAQIIKQKFPEIKMLILTTFNEMEYVQGAIEAGAVGYLLKDSSYQELVDTIVRAHKGYVQFSPGVFPKLNYDNKLTSSPILTNYTEDLQTLPPYLKALTGREKEILSLIILGRSNREISAKLFLSMQTVKNHITKILDKLNVNDRTEATKLASIYLHLLQD